MKITRFNTNETLGFKTQGYLLEGIKGRILYIGVPDKTDKDLEEAYLRLKCINTEL